MLHIIEHLYITKRRCIKSNLTLKYREAYGNEGIQNERLRNECDAQWPISRKS